jgi:hypothetical protein
MQAVLKNFCGTLVDLEVAIDSALFMNDFLHNSMNLFI